MARLVEPTPGSSASFGLEAARRKAERGDHRLLDGFMTFERWSRGGYEVGAALAALVDGYSAQASLDFLRDEADPRDWQAHLQRLPEPVRPLARCESAHCFAYDEYAALVEAWRAARADGYSRISEALVGAVETMEQALTTPPEADLVDVWFEEDDAPAGYREANAASAPAETASPSSRGPTGSERRAAPPSEGGAHPAAAAVGWLLRAPLWLLAHVGPTVVHYWIFTRLGPPGAARFTAAIAAAMLVMVGLLFFRTASRPGRLILVVLQVVPPVVFGVVFRSGP